MRYDYPHIEALLYQWGSWRNRPLRGRGPSGSVMHTPTTRDDTQSYWQPCQRCYGTGADLSKAGSGVKSRTMLCELAKTHRCPACNGRGGCREAAALADPAAIPQTGPGGMDVLVEDMPPEFADLEMALDGLGDAGRARAVIEARYVHFPRSSTRQGSQDQYGQMARVAWVNERIYPDRISGPMFGWTLSTTKRRLAEIFGLRTKRDIEEEARQAG